MRFLVDNALSPVVAAELTAAGFDAIHVRDRGMSAATDETILQFAEEDDRVVVSADTDFGTILAISKRLRPSVIQFRGQFPDEPKAQAGLILHHLMYFEEDLRTGALSLSHPAGFAFDRYPFDSMRTESAN